MLITEILLRFYFGHSLECCKGNERVPLFGCCQVCDMYAVDRHLCLQTRKKHLFCLFFFGLNFSEYCFYF